MPKQKLKAWLPSPEKLRENRIIGWFGPFLTDPRLWHMNRNSLERAVYVGILCAFFPLPGQMPLAVLGALLLRANVPMAVALTWITNPLTAIPVVWFAYSVGAYILGEPMIGVRTIKHILSDMAQWFTNQDINPLAAHTSFSLHAFLLGLIICAVVSSVIAGLLFRVFWRYHIVKQWQKRSGYNTNIQGFEPKNHYDTKTAKHK
ncbi:DUF2062 domain-containing protein [Moraxella nasovis]|uniref:DUF2062 domain-containing protein n=1 Tax=Moraxella nasovis TaxID=2904121 RepID=UPI001F617A0C|nr:DUF2062 domain-containing protein [Moraxella nasovis]UNU72955.1 DUF2062 domain-containing protein [Moraxella nasovis]